MAPLNPRAGRPRTRLTKLVKARDTHCHLCGYYVDQDRDPRRDPLGPTVDELIPISLGGDPLDPANCHLAHRICNVSRGVTPVTPELRVLCRELVGSATQPRSVVITDW